ncbi:MAG: hypothetical protein IK093_17505 [Ruminiclostridium sp.]|nr:hypothetical protein [Ruminiclostridium sp.]
MKTLKTVSAVAAAAIAISAVSVTAGATLAVAENPDPALSSTAGMWMQKIYVPSEGIDFGIDPRELGSVKFTFTPQTPEDFEGAMGGAVILSSGPTLSVDHNWPQANFWGVYDEEHELYGRDPENDENPIQIQNEGDYVYSLTLNVDDTNNVQDDAYNDDSAYVQIALSEWGKEIFTDIEVLSLELFDKSGGLIATFDGNGKFTAGPAFTGASEQAAAPAETAAPVEETPAADTASVQAGDVQAAAVSSKGSPDTGIGDVAAVAGIAIAAFGGIMIARKRK